MPMSLYDGVHYVPAPFVLSMSCVSGDEIQIAIHQREDIIPWLRKLDHEGATWTVVEFSYKDGVIDADHDHTEEIMQEYSR